jgi:hypothetical protein
MAEDREIDIGIPTGVYELLPDDGEGAALDMEQAIGGLERNLERAIGGADSREEATGYVVDAIEHLEARIERYDEFIPELRAWGQSPVYAVAWRNLYAEVIAQLYAHEWLGPSIDKERNYRLVEDGIRFGKR